MKALLIAETDTTETALVRRISPWGFDCIRYRSALKALDNIPEIAPDAVFISAVDFPRHWKTLVQFIRADASRNESVIVLLINERFTAEDVDKAVYIGVQAIIGEAMDSETDERRLADVFSRYRALPSEAAQSVEAPDSERVTFLFTNPLNGMIVTGKVERLSMTGLRFRPDVPSGTAELESGEILEQCSLKVDKAIMHVRCQIRKNANSLLLDFLNPGERAVSVISSFIGGIA